MNTKLLTHTSDIDEEDVTIIQYEAQKRVERSRFQAMRAIVKGFGLLSTIAWGVAAVSPVTLRVPAPLQGWVFVISILWFFAYCSGFFNL